MKKLLFSAVLLFAMFSVSVVEAQNVMNGLYPREHVLNRKPIPYPNVREADVLWSKTVWRVIDLREKMNLPLYYPIENMDNRYSLVQLLMHGIQYEGLTAYSTKEADEFKVEMSMEQVLFEMGAESDTVDVMLEDGTYERRVIEGELRPEEVKQILVKEVWFFDRNYSRLDVRIIGLCPIREFSRDSGGEDSQVARKQVFWIYFPQARNLLASNEVFNPKNDAQRRTFDDIFMKSYFGSYVVRESNVYNNRAIDQYAVGVEAMLESERIKSEMFNFEHDLWEF